MEIWLIPELGQGKYNITLEYLVVLAQEIKDQSMCPKDTEVNLKEPQKPKLEKFAEKKIMDAGLQPKVKNKCPSICPYWYK